MENSQLFLSILVYLDYFKSSCISVLSYSSYSTRDNKRKKERKGRKERKKRKKRKEGIQQNTAFRTKQKLIN
jgi:hypothetical protein